MRLIQVAHGGNGDLVTHILDGGGGVLGDFTGHPGSALGGRGDLARHVGDEADGLVISSRAAAAASASFTVVRQPLAGLHQAHRAAVVCCRVSMVDWTSLSGILGTARQHPHLVRHHRKTATLFAGTGRFDGRVQRQQIGLLGDAWMVERMPEMA